MTENRRTLHAQYGINSQPPVQQTGPQPLNEDFNPTQYGFRRRAARPTPISTNPLDQVPLPLLETLQRQQAQIDRQEVLIQRLTSQVSALTLERNRSSRSISDLYTQLERKVDMRDR